MSGLLSRYKGHLRNILKLGIALGTLLDVRRETECPFLVATVTLGFLSIITKIQASSPFEALNSLCLSRSQTDVRPPLQMTWGLGTFSRVYTRASDFPSSCEMKDEPAFNPLPGNPAFLLVRASRCPFHLRQQTQGSSQIPIAEGSLLLRYLWKFGIPFQSKPGNQLSSRDDLWYTELSSISCAGIGVPLDLRRVSHGISGVA